MRTRRLGELSRSREERPRPDGTIYGTAHFEPSELDVMCERVLLEHVQKRGAKIEYPVSTDLLLTLIEAHAASLGSPMRTCRPTVWMSRE